ncbi:hypothetical protein ABKV19_001173 [Rosa sericea]
MVKPSSSSSSTSQDALALFNSLRSAYSATPTALKIIDLYVGFAVSTAIIQSTKMKPFSPKLPLCRGPSAASFAVDVSCRSNYAVNCPPSPHELAGGRRGTTRD